MQSGKTYLKGNSWYFRYQEPAVHDGKKSWRDKYINLGPRGRFTSASAAEKECRQLINDALGKADAMTSDTMQLVNDFIEHVFFPQKEGVLRPSTLNGYLQVFERHLKKRLEGKRLCDFDLSVAQNILLQIVRDTPTLRSSTNIRNCKWFMASVFNLAALEKSFDSNKVNPFSKVDIADVWRPFQRERGTTPTRYATLDSVIAMIAALDEPAASVVAMAAFTGLRKSELQALKWSDLKDGQLFVQRTAWRTTAVSDETKTLASSAPVPVVPILSKFLEAHRKASPSDGFIFAGPKTRRPLALHNLAQRVICPALAKANIPWCGWHGFRRGLATTLYELGTEPKTRQAILRHADVAVTERHYTKSVDAVSVAAMDKLQAAVGSKLDKLLASKLRAVRKAKKSGRAA